MFSNVLVAIDSSDHSIKATQVAIELISQFPGAKLTLLYVTEGRNTDDEALVQEKIQEKMTLLLRELVKKDVKIPLEVLQGSPDSTIVAYAKKQRVDLIVMGKRGLNPIQEMFLGSVSYKVVQKATCPVLIIK
ncbi:universal stress protein (plasmid) [Pseudalkalibacillus hwajinpoensis]|uniref:universal stress protein n=1 Tax=Guptibacillus hwajinpoensis TaxID=208199 RepID=UPI00325A77AC